MKARNLPKQLYKIYRTGTILSFAVILQSNVNGIVNSFDAELSKPASD